MFSKSCEYGIKAIIYIATQSLSGERVKIGDIAENIDSPEAFTAKILGSLTKHEIVTSHKGPNGGFDIAPAAMDRIFLSDIVFAIDGDQIYNGCGLGLKECNAKRPCPMHQKFVSVRSELKRMLTTTSVRDLAAGIQSGKTTLIR
ncbi:MAG: Rrf2 family transcriptional regulator [Bacteroidota bacterium]|nr:Rrf2 family transcriptional regulator [Bacteroidota bacterium]MDX5429785.1 Rrf2 family transcriptional regulator [Bacteroidota bacterium]MDX5468564.1 Rrf2 family transcriptional regulator [Bacteroidota bacterium]